MRSVKGRGVWKTKRDSSLRNNASLSRKSRSGRSFKNTMDSRQIAESESLMDLSIESLSPEELSAINQDLKDSLEKIESNLSKITTTCNRIAEKIETI